METSSPLASLQPNHPGQFNRPPFAGPYSHDGPAFNFKDMSMLRPQHLSARPDYFSFNPVRGSSPTASLAADLSQNCHIDQSPQLPTPRRNLFNGPCTAFGTARQLTTPPIPTSSPGPDVCMETSPLPHKPSAAVLNGSTSVSSSSAMDLGVPTPDPTPLEESHMAAPPVPRSDLLNVPRPQSARPTFGHHRRISNGSRPSLRKGLSSACLLSEQKSLDGPFIFGSGPRSAGLPPPILESFADSPPSERKQAPTSSLVAGPPVPKLLFAENASQNGSPVGPPRRSSVTRPRVGLSRRTQSMQYNQVRPMRTEKRCCTEGNWQPSIDLHETRSLKLPHFQSEDEIDALPRITRETLANVINGDYAATVGNVTIIDCRFEYEFDGGHIAGAFNYNDKETLASALFSSDITPLPTSISTSSNSLVEQEPHTLIFHCEYSNHRAPLMAKFIRQRDRAINAHRYPALTFPDVYILDGGYSSFFITNVSRCVPQAYVEMGAPGHENTCERKLAQFKRRTKLSRAQTYAFGTAVNTAAANAGASPLPALDISLLARSPTGLDAMDIDMSYDDSPVPMPRARRNDSY